MTELFLGVDPGKTGAFAIISERGTVEHIADMPLVGNEINVAALASVIADCAFSLAVVEKTQAMPSIPRSTAHSLGMSEGLVLGVLITRGFAVRSPRPAVWKRAMSIPADKDAARAAAIRLFPAAEPLLARKRDHNRAEALLLAEYARRTWKGTQQ
jgi:crossover junction endodeoxyribonuclease RuvC